MFLLGVVGGAVFFPVHAVEPAVITLKGHEGWVTTVAFSPDGNWIVSGSEDKTLRIWDSREGGKLRVLRGHSSALSAVAISPDSKKIVSGSWDHTLKIWNAGSGKNVKTLTGHKDQVTSIEFSGWLRFWVWSTLSLLSVIILV